MSNIPITPGSGAASVAAETVGGLSYQQIEVYGGGGSSVLSVNPDGSIKASIIGTPTFALSGNASVSGTVGASIVGKVPVELSNTSVIAVIQGSIAAITTPTANQSVSGTVNVGNLPTSQNVSGSVVAFQGTSPFIITGSIQGAFAGGTSSVIQQGKWIVSVMSSAPSSMLVGASIIGTVPVNIVAGGTTGSVSGTVGASVIGWVPTQPSNTSTIGVIQGSVATVIVGGSVAVSTGNSSVQVLNFPTTQNVSGSVVASGTVTANQGTSPWIVTGSVQGSFAPAGNQSVSGTVQTDVRGSVATVIIGGSIAASFTPPANQSVSGTVGASIIGTVPTTQSGTRITSVSGTVTTIVQASVAVAIVSGSIAATFTPPANQSVSGTVNIGTGGPVSVTGTMSVLGSVPVVIVGGSVAVATGNSSVQILNFPANQSVSGAVSVSNFPTTQNVSGSVAAWIQSSNASVITVGTPVANQSVSGTVTALQGTTPWIIGSVYGNISGSVLAVPTGNQSVSGSVDIAGTPNIALTSVATAEGFIRIAPPVGATVQGVADLQVVQGASVTAIAAQGTSVFTYITGVQVTNFGSSSVLVKLAGGLGSTLGWTIAPAGGGSNIVYPTGLKTGANSAFTASINGTASVLVSAQGFISKT